jgi:hypothetical protein
LTQKQAFGLAFMGLLTAPILATLHATLALAPILLGLVAITALAMGLMGVLARANGPHAKRPARDLFPSQVLIALHEPALRSMIGRRADAPSRAPPSSRHLIRLTVPSNYAAALPQRLDMGASPGA